jgi:MoaA/NifB/PqqE/SkfB family radical SAM enzyme
MHPLPRADLKIGFACNNRCVFCAQGEKRRDCGAVPLEELVTRLVEVRRTTRGLVLTGGEPTLHKSIVKLVAAAAALGFSPIQIQTNGRMLRYEKILEALCAAGATEFAPSLHGAAAQTHDRLTRAEGSHEDTVAGIRNVVRRGLTIVTNSVITRQNLGELPALVGLLGDLGVQQAQLAFVHPVGTAFELFDEVVPRLSDCTPAVAAAREVAARRGMRLMTEAIPLCFLRGMPELAVEGVIPPTVVLDLGAQALDYSSWRVAEGKSHGPPCQGCAARDRCEGPWREYPHVFGWGEFLPLAKEER